jgi:hypothetical protein
MKATISDIVFRSSQFSVPMPPQLSENSAPSSVTLGRPPPLISSNSAGRMSAISASSSIAAWACAAVALNVCLSRFQPPTSIDAPSTSRMLPRIDPAIDAFTTSWSPAFSANRAMISSGALPNVTFSSPPIPGPERAARCSVASPISAAVGITPSAAVTKMITGDAWAISSATAMGMKIPRK